MGPYLFIGTVLPERALLSDKFEIQHFEHLSSGNTGCAKVNIINNQILVWVESECDWDIHTLRNLVKNIIDHHLDALGYIRGFAYQSVVTRVVNSRLGIDLVFGIDVPCIAEARSSIDIHEALNKLRMKSSGRNGLLIRRCLNDLASALKYADDTAFYCYRAIDSLRHHCASVNGLTDCEKKSQWEKFREVAGCDEKSLRSLKELADPLRHANIFGGVSDDRAKVLTQTWTIVDSYLETV